MSLKSSLEFYKQAKFLYKQISEIFDEFESGEISYIHHDSIINRTLNDINRLNSMLNKINIQDFVGEYSQSTLDATEKNIDFYYEAANYIEKYLLAKKYYDSLLNGVNSLLKKLNIPLIDYNRYATTENQLAKKMTNMLLHPNNISQFINQIKRIAIGTMSTNEFKKIFYTNKNKMQKLPRQRFETFKDFKKQTKKLPNINSPRNIKYNP